MSLVDRSKVTDQIGFVLNGKAVTPGETSPQNADQVTSEQPKIIPNPKPVYPRPRGNPNIINLRVD